MIKDRRKTVRIIMKEVLESGGFPVRMYTQSSGYNFNTLMMRLAHLTVPTDAPCQSSLTLMYFLYQGFVLQLLRSAGGPAAAPSWDYQSLDFGRPLSAVERR